jgi:hypothetical protein
MDELNINEIRLFLLPSRNPPKDYQREYEKAYCCWKEVWEKAFKEMNQMKPLYSDNFTRQDEIMAFFYKDICAGIITLRWYDFGNQADRDDSYFQVYPESAIKKICCGGYRIMVSSNFAINSDFRKSAYGISWKDLMTAILVKRFKASNCDALTGTGRINKGIEKASYRMGAVPICLDIPYVIDGERIDIVAWYQDAINTCEDERISIIGEEVFERAIRLAMPVIKKNA